MSESKPTGPAESNHTNIVVIDGTRHAKCQLCGVIDELRPYGPNGESVCFTCAMKDEEAAKRQFAALISGKNVIVIK